MKLYYVYILSSDSKVLYIGITNDIERRLGEHKSKLINGFSSRHDCKNLVFLEQFSEVKAAIAREKQLKKWNRAKEEWLISSQNPNWRDLSD